MSVLFRGGCRCDAGTQRGGGRQAVASYERAVRVAPPEQRLVAARRVVALWRVAVGRRTLANFQQGP